MDQLTTWSKEESNENNTTYKAGVQMDKIIQNTEHPGKYVKYFLHQSLLELIRE